jgi:hypothetical protein
MWTCKFLHIISIVNVFVRVLDSIFVRYPSNDRGEVIFFFGLTGLFLMINFVILSYDNNFKHTRTCFLFIMAHQNFAFIVDMTEFKLHRFS